MIQPPLVNPKLLMSYPYHHTTPIPLSIFVPIIVSIFVVPNPHLQPKVPETTIVTMIVTTMRFDNDRDDDRDDDEIRQRS